MNCADFEKQLHESFVAARLDETADLEEHARHCPACCATLEQFQLLSDALGAWRSQVPDVELVDAILAARRSEVADPKVLPPAATAWSAVTHRSEPASVSASSGAIAARSALPWGPFREKPVRWLAAGGVAALVLVTLTLTWPRQDTPSSGTTPPLVGEQTTGANAPQDGRDLRPTAPRMDEPQAAAPDLNQGPYHDLAERAAGALGEVTAYVVPGSSTRPMRPSDARPGGSEGAGAWIDGLRHQLKPIGRSLDHTFDFLWEAGQSADSSKT